MTAPFEKTFLRILKRHLSRDFPNPKRAGCPSKRELNLLAAEPAKVEAWIVEHLLSCSPCHLAYSRILRKQKTKRDVPKQSGKSGGAAARK